MIRSFSDSVFGYGSLDHFPRDLHSTNHFCFLQLPVLSLCRSRGKGSKDSYPAHERIIDPKTRLAPERNIDPKTWSGGERFVHLPDTSLWIIFHVTCIGSALVARENRNDSFILTRSSDKGLWIIFHVTCIQRIISVSLAEPMQVPMRGHEKMNKSFFERTRYSRVLVRIRSK